MRGFKGHGQGGGRGAEHAKARGGGDGLFSL